MSRISRFYKRLKDIYNRRVSSNIDITKIPVYNNLSITNEPSSFNMTSSITIGDEFTWVYLH